MYGNTNTKVACTWCEIIVSDLGFNIQYTFLKITKIYNPLVFFLQGKFKYGIWVLSEKNKINKKLNQ